MAIRSGFFNSVNGDRRYDAKRFAEYFATFIGNGVFPNPSTNLEIISNNDMTVTVMAGKAWINGYIIINDDDYILELEPSDGVLSRIDRIVARYDVVDREIRLEVKKGTFASNPVAPSLQRDADAYELGLADILVSNGVISVTQSDITDLRLNNDLCGIVHGTVDQVDTTTLFNQYLTWLEEKKTQYDADMLQWTSNKQQEFENWTDIQEQDFNSWFASIQDILDENVAANLLNMINENTTAIEDVDGNVKSHLADYATLAERVSNLKSNDVQARREILDIKLKLDEMNIVEYLNKTGIGFYDLFENTDYIDMLTTSATVDIENHEVTFEGNQLLKMKEQQFENFTELELAVHDKEREEIEVDKSSTNNTVEITVGIGNIVVGDRFFYNGETYVVQGVQEI